MNNEYFIIISVVLVVVIYFILSEVENRLFLKNGFKTGFKSKRSHKTYIIKNCKTWHFDDFNDSYDAITIFFCHGNYGDIGMREYVIEFCYRYKLNLILYDYRGFGNSKGSASVRLLYEDGDNVLKYFFNKGLSIERTIIWGESMGGYVATYLSSKYNPYKCILMASFYSIDRVINSHGYYKFSYFCRFFMNNLPTINFIGNITAPILIVHSVDDELVKFEENAIPLFEEASEPKLLVKIKGTHSSPEIDKENFQQIISFISDEYLVKTDDILSFHQVVPLFDE